MKKQWTLAAVIDDPDGARDEIKRLLALCEQYEQDIADFAQKLTSSAEPSAPEPLTLLLREVLKTTAKMRNMCPPEAFAKIDPLLHRIAAAIDSKPGAGSNEPSAPHCQQQASCPIPRTCALEGSCVAAVMAQRSALNRT